MFCFLSIWTCRFLQAPLMEQGLQNWTHFIGFATLKSLKSGSSRYDAFCWWFFGWTVNVGSRFTHVADPVFCLRLQGVWRMAYQRSISNWSDFNLFALRILTPPMETPDPPNDTPGASKQVVLTPHDIPNILRVTYFVPRSGWKTMKMHENTCAWSRVNKSSQLLSTVFSTSRIFQYCQWK